MAPDDYYAVLGVSDGATDDELRRAWHARALECHPDHAGNDAAPRFREVSAAYAVLSDPMARVAYDRWREQTGRSTRVSAIVPPPRRAPGIMLSRLSGPLNALVARRVVRLADDGLYDLFVDADEAASGGMVTISMRVPVRSGEQIIDDLFAAWLAIRPGVLDGTVLTPSAWLPGMLAPVYFRVRLS